MKRTPSFPLEFVVLAALVLAFAALSDPAHAAPCMRVGEYYPVARQCVVERVAMDGALPRVALLVAVAGLTAGVVWLRRQMLRMRSAF